MPSPVRVPGADQERAGEVLAGHADIALRLAEALRRADDRVRGARETVTLTRRALRSAQNRVDARTAVDEATDDYHARTSY